MAYITLKEYAARHGKNPIIQRQKILRGTFPAVKIGRDWMVDEDEPYVDQRIKTGDYVDWRKSKNNEKKD